jgi:hypothetical protein
LGQLNRACVVSALVVSVVALSGCGHSSGHSAPAAVTVPAYGVYSQTTVPGSAASGVSCGVSARRFARDARMFLAHVRPHGAYPADLYYVILRDNFAGFQAHRCDAKLLGSALANALTAKQRRALIVALPNPMAGTVGKGLRRAGA